MGLALAHLVWSFALGWNLRLHLAEGHRNLETCLCVQSTVAYHLVLDNKKRINTDSYLKDELTEVHDAHNQYPSGKSQGLTQPSFPLVPLLSISACCSRNLMEIIVAHCFGLPSAELPSKIHACVPVQSE